MVLSIAIAGAAATAIAMLALYSADRLVAPPLAATDCIDEKLAFLREQKLETIALMAVGSSATWRNLDAREFAPVVAGPSLNAAPCYLYVHQTAACADMLLARATAVETVVTFLHPRDFEACSPADASVVDRELTLAFLDGRAPGWAIHAINFRLDHIVREAFEIRAQRDPSNGLTVANDAHGRSPMPQPYDFFPPPVFDERCFAALSDLETVVRASGARLVIASLPVMPEWARRYDPDGAIVSEWTTRIEARLAPPTLFVDGARLSYSDDDFADAVHLTAEAGSRFSRYVASQLASP